MDFEDTVQHDSLTSSIWQYHVPFSYERQQDYKFTFINMQNSLP